MSKEHAFCPWCGAHFTQEEKNTAIKQRQQCCPLCGRPITVKYSGKRVGAVLLLAALLCVLDFGFLLLGVPLAAVWLITAVCAALLWGFRGSTVVFEKAGDAEETG